MPPRTLSGRRGAATAILPLSEVAISQIKSSITITSLTGVVISLLENCIDAQSSRIEISVDFRRGSCEIDDNGDGIPPNEFVETGGLGRMYFTSKHQFGNGSEKYGTHGVFLASLAALSFLTVTSRHCKDASTNTLVMHRSNTLSRLTPAPPCDGFNGSHGTRVTVRDLFGNMPVRVKQRALTSDSAVEDERSWRELRRRIAALLLAWKSPCAVRLRDTNADSRALNITTLHPSFSSALTEKSLNALAGRTYRFELSDVLPILIQFGLAPTNSRIHWVSVSASTSTISVRGAINLDPAPTKHCQFVNIGIRPCLSSSTFNDLYDAVNNIFTNSSFGSVDDCSDPDDAEKDRRKRDLRYRADGYTSKQIHGKKSVDRWPMFVLQIQLNSASSVSSSTKDASDVQLKAIIDVLEAMAREWLKMNHFRPHKLRRRRNEMQEGPASSSLPVRSSSRPATPSTHFQMACLKRVSTANTDPKSVKRQKLDSGTPRSMSAVLLPTKSPSRYFSNWTRIKSGSAAFFDEMWTSGKQAIEPPRATGAAPTGLESPNRGPFTLPPLIAGRLNESSKAEKGVTRQQQQATPALNIDLPLLPYTAPAVEVAVPSSEDFGSIDEGEMLAIEANSYAVPQFEQLDHNDEPIIMRGKEACDDPISEWTDPVSKEIFYVNARTGVVLPSDALRCESANPERNHAAINIELSSTGRPLVLSKRIISATPGEGPRTAWLDGFLKEWRNPVFAPQMEQAIPVVSLDGSGVEVGRARNNCCSHDDMAKQFAKASEQGGTSKLSKSALRDAMVIRQLDRKFILVRMPSADTAERYIDGQEILVLMDQHAASERVILEGLLTELCATMDPTTYAASFRSNVGCTSTVGTVILQTYLRFQIAAEEQELLTRHAPHFARWGVLYDLAPRSAEPVDGQRGTIEQYDMSIRALPPGIAERCKLFPKLLIEFLRMEIWSLSDAVKRRKPTAPPSNDIDQDSDPHAWLRHIGSCPQGIINMLNSRACRSAIMFNDELSHAQCEELVADLSRCGFPFMCAHGRVSMVPLIQLREDGDGLGRLGNLSAPRATEGRPECFSTAFKQWQREVDSAQENGD